MAEPLVRDVGEQGLLKRLQAFCPPEVVGDDAAVLTSAPGQSLIVTTDMLVEGVHFSAATTGAEDVGWRAAAANLSDLAAMGAHPLGLTVALGIPGDRAIVWIEQLYQGLAACLQAYQTVIVGGDICRSSVMTVAITAVGEAAPPQILYRSGAQPGDVILVTGVHGASRAGLELLLHPEQGKDLTADERACVLAAHQRPHPRLDVLPHLWAVIEPLSCLDSRRLAAMDSSDGLADAVLQICRASGVGARLERSQIPLWAGYSTWLSTEQALEWALYGGEDFELVLGLPLAIAEPLLERLGCGAAIIGRITADPGVWLVDATDAIPAQRLTLERGFQHFGRDR